MPKSLYEVIAELGGNRPGQLLERDGQQYFAASEGPVAGEPFTLQGLGGVSGAQQFAYPNVPQQAPAPFVDGPVTPDYVRSRVGARELFGMPQTQVQEIPAGPVVAQMMGIEPDTREQLMAMAGAQPQPQAEPQPQSREQMLPIAVSLAQKLSSAFMPGAGEAAIPASQMPGAWRSVLGLSDTGGWSADFIDQLSDEETAMLQQLIHAAQKTQRQEELDRQPAVAQAGGE